MATQNTSKHSLSLYQEQALFSLRRNCFGDKMVMYKAYNIPKLKRLLRKNNYSNGTAGYTIYHLPACTLPVQPSENMDD